MTKAEIMRLAETYVKSNNGVVWPFIKALAESCEQLEEALKNISWYWDDGRSQVAIKAIDGHRERMEKLK